MINVSFQLEAQVKTWASHANVRHYWGFTELQVSRRCFSFTF